MTYGNRHYDRERRASVRHRPGRRRRGSSGRRLIAFVIAVVVSIAVGTVAYMAIAVRLGEVAAGPGAKPAITDLADGHLAHLQGRGHKTSRWPHRSSGHPGPSSPASSHPAPSSASPSSPASASDPPSSSPSSPSAAPSSPSSSTPGSCASSAVSFAVGSRSWPDCTNTGAPAGQALKSLNSPDPTGDGNSTVTNITKDGTVINGVNLTGGIDVWANNVTIENSRISADSWWGINLREGYSNLKVLHCTIVGQPGRGPDNGGEDYGVSSAGGYVEIGWSDISEFGEGISLGTGDVHDSYVHDLQAFIPDGSSSYEHLDALISDGGSGLTVEHNTMLDQFSPQKGASASIGLFDDSQAVTDTTVTDNFIAGGAFALYPGGGSTSQGITVTDNVFSTMYWSGSGYYGPDATEYWHGGSGNTWSGNTWADGSAVGKTVSP